MARAQVGGSTPMRRAMVSRPCLMLGGFRHRHTAQGAVRGNDLVCVVGRCVWKVPMTKGCAWYASCACTNYHRVYDKGMAFPHSG